MPTPATTGALPAPGAFSLSLSRLLQFRSSRGLKRISIALIKAARRRDKASPLICRSRGGTNTRGSGDTESMVCVCVMRERLATGN